MGPLPLLLLLFAAGFVFRGRADGEFAEEFSCLLCKQFVERMVRNSEAPENACQSAEYDACPFLWPTWTALPELEKRRILFGKATPAAETCARLGWCPIRDLTSEALPMTEEATDVRVGLSFGARGAYGTVRVTAVDNAPLEHRPSFTSFFNYSASFEYFWTQKTVHTTLLDVVPGVTNRIDVGGEFTLPIRLSLPGNGTRIVFIGDPCITSTSTDCPYGEKYRMLDNMPRLLNLLSSQEDSLNLWGLLGDNFYDTFGDITPHFFSRLSLSTKATPLVSVLGNHDYWQYGTPEKEGNNTYGNGYMQYYAVDSVAAFNGGPSEPFDFSHNPQAAEGQTSKEIALENTIHYSTLGNVGFITFSGAYHHDDARPYFAEACSWFSNLSTIENVFVIGHWSKHDKGCEKKMTSKEVYDYVSQIPGCADVANGIRFFEGHTHCNEVVVAQTGFRVGGFGKRDHHHPEDCGNFGIPFIDTHNGTFSMFYFPIGDVSMNQTQVDENWSTLLECVEQKGGLHACADLAEIWS